jgi:hypothetical protein
MLARRKLWSWHDIMIILLHEQDDAFKTHKKHEDTATKDKDFTYKVEMRDPPLFDTAKIHRDTSK